MAGGALGAAATGVSPGGAWGKSLPTFVSHFLLATASFFIVGSAPLLSLTILPGKKKTNQNKKPAFYAAPLCWCRFHSFHPEASLPSCNMQFGCVPG